MFQYTNLKFVCVYSQGMQAFGNGMGTFHATPSGLRPPPIRGTTHTPNVMQVPCPYAAETSRPSFMSFIPTPRGPPRGPTQP